MMKPVYDGRRFQYPGQHSLPSRWEVLRWALTRRPARWPAQLKNPPADPLVERVQGSALRVTFINHATVLIQTEGVNLLTDPVYSQRVSPIPFAGPARRRPPGIALADLPPVDLVLISHCHYDHLDTQTLATLAQRDAPRILAPLNNGTIIRKATRSCALELDWWNTYTVTRTLSVTLVPARHWSSRTAHDANHALWGGYVINLAAGSVYFAGDTGFGDGRHFAEARDFLGPFRLALLPIGAYEPRWIMRAQHMNPAEAVQALKVLQAQFALGIHFGTFQLTDETYDAPLKDLTAALLRENGLAARFRALENGQAWNVPAL